jgi:hypothetical protein
MVYTVANLFWTSAFSSQSIMIMLKHNYHIYDSSYWCIGCARSINKFYKIHKKNILYFVKYFKRNLSLEVMSHPRQMSLAAISRLNSLGSCGHFQTQCQVQESWVLWPSQTQFTCVYLPC